MRTSVFSVAGKVSRGSRCRKSETTSAVCQTGSSSVPSIRGACDVRVAVAERSGEVDTSTCATADAFPATIRRSRHVRPRRFPQAIPDRRACLVMVMPQSMMPAQKNVSPRQLVAVRRPSSCTRRTSRGNDRCLSSACSTASKAAACAVLRRGCGSCASSTSSFPGPCG